MQRVNKRGIDSKRTSSSSPVCVLTRVSDRGLTAVTSLILLGAGQQ